MTSSDTQSLASGLYFIPERHLAAIVTYLTRTLEEAPLKIVRDDAKCVRIPASNTEDYIELFRRVGAPWLWASRLRMPHEQLTDRLGDKDVEVYAVIIDKDARAGLLELDFRSKGQCNIALLGIAQAYTEKGYGSWLMSEALQFIHTHGATHVSVDTCTLDHPSSLNFYRKWGFIPFRRAVEILPDPRYSGLLPEKSAANHPML